MVPVKVYKVAALLVALQLVGSSLLVGCTKPAPAPNPTFKWPDPLVITAADVGSQGYSVAAGVGDVMLKKGISIRIVPVGTDPGRISLLTGGRVHVAYLPSATNYVAREGAFDFAAIDWGPQPLYVGQVGIPNEYTGLMTAKDANIKTWADAKGKRIAFPTGSANFRLTGGANLAFGGLTWKDVKIVEVPSFAAASRAVLEGTADASIGGSGSAWVTQLAASPRGVWYPPMTHADEAGWKRANAVAPFYQKTVTSQGAGISAANPIEGGTYSYANVTFLEGSDPELVYNYVKMVNELYPMYKGTVPGIEQFDPERITLSAAAPYHPAAIRYYKEVGKWTADNQKNNDRLVARGKVLMQAWDKAVAEASKQKVNVQNFPSLWTKIRTESLEAAGMEVIFR